MKTHSFFFESIYNRAMDKEINGIKVSPIALGCDSKPFKFGFDCTNILDDMLKLGINLFDTARGYGHSEEALGKWIKLRNNRDKIFIYTKGCLPGLFSRMNPKALRHDIETSLKTLGTYIDCYLFHRDDKRCDLKVMFGILNEYVAKGLIKSYGVSNWHKERIEEANRICKENGWPAISIVSNNMTAVKWVKDPWGGGDGCVSISRDKNEIEYYKANQIPMMSYSPLARGFLTGKVKSDYSATWNNIDGASRRAYLSKENLKVLNRIEALARKKKTTVANISLSYLASKGMNIFPVVGTTSVERMKENLNAISNPLTEEEVKIIEEE